MKNRSTQDPFPEEVTNRPRDLRLIAMSGAVRQARHEPSPTWLLVLGVLLGILMCMALNLWREAERAASERHGQLPAANPTGAASAQQAFDLRLARSANWKLTRSADVAEELNGH